MIRLPKTSLVLGALAGIVAIAATAALAGPRAAPSLAFVLEKGSAPVYISASGTTSTTFPGRLNTGDRILSNDRLSDGHHQIGYDNEICTVTFTANDLCQVVGFIAGKGEFEATWLWIGRNTAAYRPRPFSGVIDGGTGAFASARGQFDATVLANGSLRFSAALS
jgi:hypothetical protein